MTTAPTIFESEAAHELEREHKHYIPSMLELNVTLVALLFFTVLTVAASRVDLGESVNLWVAIGISVVKGSFVALVFMHLKNDKAMNSIVLFFCFLTIAFFLMFTIIDLSSRGRVDPMRAGAIAPPAVVQQARERAIAEGRLDLSEHKEGGAEHESEPTEH